MVWGHTTHRSDSDSKGGSVYNSESDDHKSRRRDSKTNESEAPHGSRGDPEGSYDDDYIAVKSAPADNIRSRTGSTAVAGVIVIMERLSIRTPLN